jgi:hypothetical protein
MLEEERDDACSELLELSAARESCFLALSIAEFTASTYAFIFAESTFAVSALAESALAVSATAESGAAKLEEAGVSTLLEETTTELDTGATLLELGFWAGTLLELTAALETGAGVAAGATLLELGVTALASLLAGCSAAWASASNSAKRSRV